MTIVVEDFHKTYDGTVAVAGISFTVAAGEILGLAGPNGAGKTTTLRALSGILTPTRGTISIAGHDLRRDPIRAKAALAYIPDEPRLFDRLTVWEHFKFIASVYNLEHWQPDAETLLQRLELTEKRDSATSELSRGMRQKVAIGCGYLHHPQAIFFDEPLTGLDPRGIRTMKDMIKEAAARGAAIIVSSHLLSLLEDLVTTVLIILRGQVLLHDSLAALKGRITSGAKQETLEELFLRLTESPKLTERTEDSSARQL